MTENVSLRDHVDRIFQEKEKLTVRERETVEQALLEAKTSVEARLVEAKTAADTVQAGNVKRLDALESGGAPFASRLDESLTKVKDDVEVLNANLVKTTVLDALREQTVNDSLAQKRQIRNLFWTVGATVFVMVVSLSVTVVLSFIK
jgi:hypothetical protein